MARTILKLLTSFIRKYPDDQVAFISCILLSYPLGIVYRQVLHPSIVSSSTRQLTGLIWGVVFAWICFNWQLFIILSTTALCYLLTIYVHPNYVHRVVFAVSLTILSASHLLRQMYDYGGYKLDYTGPLMILVQKVTYVSLSVHDGQGRDEKELSPEQKKEQLKKAPSLLEYFGYALHYSMLLSGPSCTYGQYKDFINGSSKEDSKKDESPFIPVSKKSLCSLLCLLLFLNFSPIFPIAKNADTLFISSQSFLWRLLYSWISIAALRMQYYFAFKAGEAINNLCGLGFVGYDKDGNALWDSMANVNIFQVEFGLNVKMVLENWNISTVLWLRRCVYDRLTSHRTLGVFVLSAVWHGFYGGYYLTFITCQLMVEAARAVRRAVREKFQTTRFWSHAYDVITCVATTLCLTYITVPFALLDLWAGLRFWWSMYFYGHVTALLVLIVLRGKSSQFKPQHQKTNSNENGVTQIHKQK